jgi:hypothetical protein
MARIVIKTPDGMYVGGGRETELVDRITRAYLHEDGPDTDSQIAQVNRMYRCGWYKVDAETEYDKWIKNQGD